jgi:SAM-dependent methyltransferase
MGYIFSDEWHRERERLASIELVADPNTVELLQRIGVQPGWRCAEVGAGTGSIAEWLATEVGPDGQVVATDLDTRFLRALDRPNLQVLEHDLTRDDRPGEPFDLVHARLVIEHVDDPVAAVKRLTGWLRPGGWLMLEDVDWSTRFAVTPAPELEQTVTAGLGVAASAVGYDSAFGRRLPALLVECGLTDLDAQIRAPLVHGGTADVEFLKLTVERLVPAITAASLVSDSTAAAALATCADPGFVCMPQSMVSAWARLPHSSRS